MPCEQKIINFNKNSYFRNWYQSSEQDSDTRTLLPWTDTHLHVGKDLVDIGLRLKRRKKLKR